MIRFGRLFTVISIITIIFTHFDSASAATGGTNSTHVTPYLDAVLESGRNTVFCATFQIVWNEMRDDIIKEEILLDEQLDLVSHLNRGLSTEEDISSDDYLAMVGFGADNIADRINRALKAKFGSEAPVVDDKFNDDDVILAYAYLKKILRFENAFEDFKHPLTFHSGENQADVEAFGILKYSGDHHANLHEQVEIIEYSHENDFIIRLKSEHPDDEIILAMTRPGKTLLETYESVNWKIARSERNSTVGQLENNDVLQIPKIDVSIDHIYSSLLGLNLLNSGYEDYFVAEARQDIRFSLDESGATALSEAIFALKKGGANFRIMLFEKPFMIYLKKKDASYPYLALWVGNTDFLVEN